MAILKIIQESISQAIHQLTANRLRTFLSLLGISIGIFSIIGVLSVVDSLEDNIRGSFEKLGNNVIYVSKWPWADVSGDWVSYFKRPQPSYSDYTAVKEKVRNAELVSYQVGLGNKTAKWSSRFRENIYVYGSSLELDDIYALNFTKGRYFSASEIAGSANKIVLGWEVAEDLFGEIDPIGRDIKMAGKRFEVIGVIEKSGEGLLNPVSWDDSALITYNSARALANLESSRSVDGTVTIKAKPNVSLDLLKDEVRGIIRNHRRLKPRAKDDFSLNEMSSLTSLMDNFFSVLNLLGVIIGIFAIIVGMVSVANIMFVSVKERTNIIGVKKALGAKRWIILLEFLLEAILLCLIGGIAGMILVFIATNILTSFVGFDLYIDMNNVLLGVSMSIIVGVIAGFVPALSASRLDPVEAMRK